MNSLQRETRSDERGNLPFQPVEAFNCRLDRGSSLFFDFPGPVKGLFCNAADFVQQLADLDLQAIPALLDAIENIVLYARAVHFQKMPQKLSSLFRDYFACTHQRQQDVGQPAQR